ncbi:uncharacterized protein N7477_000591 [Penicillium maclennaniae]|uniref:uncharacterized protein n=1 Tax=Penicillium maclennaniae TaxID=1343394 RepID=UPI00253F88C9|nr:uncharacterized protein N7477_000591 [Penicillium maclennaniae]KAJ5684246.1 hypothetical protein N7477_000591 [Penicillium maclennaniae]
MTLFNIPELKTRTGTLRAYHLAAIVFISSFLSAYDSGIAGGILTYKSFENDFRYSAAQKSRSRVSSLTVGLEQLGSFIAAGCVYPLTNKYGRKICIIASTALFVVGVIIQVINTRSLAAWYIGRIVAGLGMGGHSVVIPMYSAEMTPKEIRGRCGSFTSGSMLGVSLSHTGSTMWVSTIFGVSETASLAGSSREWQIPVGLQLISGGILFIGTLTLPESIRWLLTQNRTDDAWKSIVWIRGGDGDKTSAEFAETQLGLQAERAEREGLRNLLNQRTLGARKSSALLRWTSHVYLSKCDGKQRAGCICSAVLQAHRWQRYEPQHAANRSLRCRQSHCMYNFIWVLAERLSRRMTLVGGALLMAMCMLITAHIVDYIPTQSSTNVTAAGRATAAMIYLDIIVKIFLTRIRALGLAVSMLAHWASSFCFSFASPYMISKVGANTFLIFMGFNFVAAVFCWFFVKETRGKNLEVAAGTEWEAAERTSREDGEKGVVVGVDGK